MIFPPWVQFYEDNQLIVWRPRGLLDERAVSDVVALLGQLEAERREPFNRFWDSIRTDQVELNYEYMISVALYRRFAYANRPPIKTAILTIDSQLYHYVQLHALLTRGSSIAVRIFQNDREAVAKWLGVPIELVAAEPEAEGNNPQMTGA